MKTLYWNVTPGKFVDRLTGDELRNCPEWKGTPRDWYETLVDTVIELVGALGCDGNKSKVEITVSPNVHTILFCSRQFNGDETLTPRRWKVCTDKGRSSKDFLSGKDSLEVAVDHGTSTSTGRIVILSSYPRREPME